MWVRHGAVLLVLGILGMGILVLGARGNAQIATAGTTYDRVVDDGDMDCTASSGVPVHTTIDEALTVAQPSEAIFICPGTYVEPTLTISDANVTLQGAGPDMVTVRSSTTAGFVFQINASGVSLLDMTIDAKPETENASDYNVNVFNANNATVSGNVLLNAKVIALRISHNTTPPTGVSISGNEIEADGSAIGAGITCVCNSSTFQGNTIYTTFWAIGIEAVTLDGDNLTVSGNTFDGVAASAGGDNNSIMNNSFSGAQPAHAAHFQLRVSGLGVAVAGNTFTDSGAQGGAVQAGSAVSNSSVSFTKNIFNGPSVTGISLNENLPDDAFTLTATINGGLPADANVFMNPQNFNLLVQLNNVAADIDAENNNWGLCTTEEIEAKIFDGVDNGSLGTVDYDPFIASNCPTASPTPTPSPTSTPTPTPTATASGSPTVTVSGSPSVTPTVTPTPTGSPGTATPTPTPTPTITGTPTFTATPPPGQQVAWGDHNCSGSADPVDALLNLRHDAGLPAETNECPELGATVDVGGTDRIWGDLDCSGAADPVDGLKVLRFDAGLEVQRPDGCPDPGETVTVAPS